MAELLCWRTLAALRFTGASIVGRGQFAVVACDSKAVWLAPTEDNARAAALGSCHLGSQCKGNHAIKNLVPCPTAPRCKDFGYSDRDERRKYGSD